MTEPDDRLLVARAARGDAGAFEGLYRRHAPRTYALCLRLCGDRALAEDLVQESFVQAWRALGDFRGEAAFGTWLHRIATHVALGALRRRPAWDATADGAEPGDGWPASPGPGPASVDLERAIAALPPRARAVFVLHDVEGYRHPEIGEMLAIAEGTCRALLHQARQALIGRLG